MITEMEESEVRKQLDIAFEYCYAHNVWVNSLDDALAGVTSRAALWRPIPPGKGIWDIVLHLAVWNENIVERTESGERVHPEEGEWPATPDHPDEAAWAAAKRRLVFLFDSGKLIVVFFLLVV